MKQTTQVLGNDHERTDAHVGPLVQFLIFLAVVCGASFYAMSLLLKWFHQQPVPLVGNVEHPLAQDRVQPPEPRLETARDAKGNYLVGKNEAYPDLTPYFTAQTIGGLRARESERLHTYGWVDKSQNLVHIPIDQAIELTLKKGLPVAEKKK